MSRKKQFVFSVSGSVTLSVDEIWPDGDAPENPTADDVRCVIAEEGGFGRVLGDWSLEDAFDFDVFEIQPRKEP